VKVRTRGGTWLALLLTAGAVGSVRADGQGQTPRPSPPPPASSPRATPPELAASREAAKLTDPAARVKALDEILAKYPASPYLVDFHVQKIAALQAASPIDRSAIDLEIVAATSASTPRTPHEVLNLVAMTLQTSDATVSRAETLERQAIGMLDEETYARDWQKRYTRHPDDPKEAAAQYKEGKARFAGDLSRYELTLGRILVKEGRPAEAQTAFEKSLEVVPLQGAASLALAALAEARGDTAEAYRRLAWAAVTGRLSAVDRPRLEAAYAQLHSQARPGDLEADLDRLFRESFHNPIVATPYVPTPARTRHTVLAEMFTGAGCVPCLSPDLSFEAMLDRYSRDDLVVLMYHFHAPSPDPLSNPYVQTRAQFYAVDGAPTIFLDGTPETAEGPREDAPEIYGQIDQAVRHLLDTRPGASIHLSATIHDGVVSAHAEVGGLSGASSDLRLHVALVERLVRYSGENGQRFHPMVVRALGGPEAKGFAIDPATSTSSVNQTFDLAALAAENLKYYDDYAADLKTRVGLTVTFLEKKAVIDPGNVAVAAFVQDNKSQRVLDAAWVTPVVQPTAPVVWSATRTDPAGPVHAGDRISLKLAAHLGPEWHLYALTMSTPQGPRPTVITVPPGQPFTLAGEIDAPMPVSRYDPNFDADLAFYEDDVAFVVPVTVAASARPGVETLTVAVTYQMCTNRLCLPVTQATTSVPVAIK
jgi:tetratricopeptide (TPR) repeat protein